jgi:hypothetical protein
MQRAVPREVDKQTTDDQERHKYDKPGKSARAERIRRQISGAECSEDQNHSDRSPGAHDNT